MPSGLVSITRAKMQLDRPYFTKSKLRPKDKDDLCSVCNQIIPLDGYRLAAFGPYDKTAILFCASCMMKEVETTVAGLMAVKADAEKLDLSTEIDDRHSYGVAPKKMVNNIAYQPGLGYSVRASVHWTVNNGGYNNDYQKSERERHEKHKCVLCDKVYLIANPKLTHNRQPQRQIIEFHHIVDWERPKAERESRHYCKECFLPVWDRYIEEWTNLLATIKTVVGTVKKTLELHYATVGNLGTFEHITISNATQRHPCIRCKGNAERTCVTLYESPGIVGQLCMYCAEEHCKDKIRAYQQAMKLLDDLRADRCRTCPADTQARCIVKGIAVPIEADEATLCEIAAIKQQRGG